MGGPIFNGCYQHTRSNGITMANGRDDPESGARGPDSMWLSIIVGAPDHPVRCLAPRSIVHSAYLKIEISAGGLSLVLRSHCSCRTANIFRMSARRAGRCPQ